MTMTPVTTSPFDLPDRLARKADPALIAADEAHFAAIATTLEETIGGIEERLDVVRRAPGGRGQGALDRDLEIHRLSSRLRALRRFGLDLCLGRMVEADADEPVYIGRFGLTDHSGRKLLVDWRAPAAEPFFAATHGDPMGLASRRRYRWTSGRVTDYWDEVFTPDELAHNAALDDQSAFIASLGTSRSPRMRDVLATIQADQDAIIRAGSTGALVVDGGPGTGKTVVALHRTAFLLYADPRLAPGRGGVLFVGPHPAYLAYVDDVLPSLGEESVQICTLRDLVEEGRAAEPETDPHVARLKASVHWGAAIERAVALQEQPPTESLLVETPWADVWIDAADWAEAFDSAEPGTTHNEARDQVWEALVAILADRVDDEDVTPAMLRRALAQDADLTRTFTRAWPLVEASDLVATLWSSPSFLTRCAPWLSPPEVQRLQRAEASSWTTADLPILDAARQRLGDPQESRRRRRSEAILQAEREERARVTDELIAADDSEMLVMMMLRGQDFLNSLDDGAAAERPEPDGLAGPFAHIVVDEAQELTDAEWQMLLRRCPSRSFTIVGDRAQARHGFTQSWEERLEGAGLRGVELASLTINYRTPEEVMLEAEPVIRAAIPDANVPTSIRRSGIPVQHAPIVERDAILDAWLAEHEDGIAAVIGDASFPARPRVSSLTAESAKGLEFDLVVLVDPDGLGEGIEGAVDRYVSMTRATERLVILTP